MQRTVGTIFILLASASVVVGIGASLYTRHWDVFIVFLAFAVGVLPVIAILFGLADLMESSEATRAAVERMARGSDTSDRPRASRDVTRRPSASVATEPEGRALWASLGRGPSDAHDTSPLFEPDQAEPRARPTTCRRCGTVVDRVGRDQSCNHCGARLPVE